MKKLEKITVNVIQDNYPVMSKEQLNSVLGGVDVGTCLFNAIAYATGYSANYVQSVFAQWALENNSDFYGSTYDIVYQNVAYWGPDFGKETFWLLNYFGLYDVSIYSGSDGVILMYIYGEDGELDVIHAVNVISEDGDYYHYYDASNDEEGDVHKDDVDSIYE